MFGAYNDDYAPYPEDSPEPEILTAPPMARATALLPALQPLLSPATHSGFDENDDRMLYLVVACGVIVALQVIIIIMLAVERSRQDLILQILLNKRA
jgi:hypothetical protein